MQIARVHNDEGSFCAVFAEPQRKWVWYVCIAGYPVRKRKMYVSHMDRDTRPLMKGDKPYPLKRAAREMLRVGRQYGITGGAKRLLKEALA